MHLMLPVCCPCTNWDWTAIQLLYIVLVMWPVICKGMLGYTPSPLWTEWMTNDTPLWKHNLPATTVVGSNNKQSLHITRTSHFLHSLNLISDLAMVLIFLQTRSQTQMKVFLVIMGYGPFLIYKGMKWSNMRTVSNTITWCQLFFHFQWWIYQVKFWMLAPS